MHTYDNIHFSYVVLKKFPGNELWIMIVQMTFFRTYESMSCQRAIFWTIGCFSFGHWRQSSSYSAVKSSLPAQVSRLKNLPIAMDESYGFNALLIRMCKSIIWDPLSCPQCVFIYLDLSISIEKLPFRLSSGKKHSSPPKTSLKDLRVPVQLCIWKTPKKAFSLAGRKRWRFLGQSWTPGLRLYGFVVHLHIFHLKTLIFFPGDHLVVGTPVRLVRFEPRVPLHLLWHGTGLGTPGSYRFCCFFDHSNRFGLITISTNFIQRLAW